jgi:hypothetical protein
MLRRGLCRVCFDASIRPSDLYDAVLATRHRTRSPGHLGQRAIGAKGNGNGKLPADLDRLFPASGGAAPRKRMP